MYGGHNCTNYVAYRMVQAGIAQRPWSGSGNASNWGVALKQKVDNNPTIGSIAWWKKMNHVAYVEDVIDANTIVVSEDHSTGSKNFNWRKVHRSGNSWPDGFIHLADEELTPLTAPQLLGKAQVGVEISATDPDWVHPAPQTTRFQWYADEVPIAGATAAMFTPPAALARKQLHVVVTGQRDKYRDGEARSASVRVVRGAFTQVSAPFVTGTPRVGDEVSVEVGQWSPTPRTVIIQWFADDQPLRGYTQPTITVPVIAVGKRLRAEVTINAKGFKKHTVATAASEPVKRQRIGLTQATRLQGKPRVRKLLRATPGRVEPADATIAYRWLRDGKVIPGQRQPEYRLTPADARHHIAVRVIYRAPGYAKLVEETALQERVRGVAKIAVRVRPKKRRVIVRVRNTAPGKTRGHVELTNAAGKTITRPLVRQRVRVRQRWVVKTGTQPLTVSYLGSPKVGPRQVTRKVNVG